jgi:hypothetical protein
MIPNVPIERKKRASAVMNQLYGKQGWEAVQKWWSKSPLKGIVDVERLALTFNSTAYGTFMTAGSMLADASVKMRQEGFAARIELYGDALPITLYHEAWHAFSQLVLTMKKSANMISGRTWNTLILKKNLLKNILTLLLMEKNKLVLFRRFLKQLKK